MDGWTEKNFFFFLFIYYLLLNFYFLWTFLIIYFTYFLMVHSFRGGGCKDPLQPHAYLVIMFTFVYIVFFTSNNHTYECTLLFNNRKGSCSFWFRSKEDILEYRKTITMVLPIILSQGQVAITISPLKLLQDTQVCALKLPFMMLCYMPFCTGCRVQSLWH